MPFNGDMCFLKAVITSIAIITYIHKLVAEIFTENVRRILSNFVKMA